MTKEEFIKKIREIEKEHAFCIGDDGCSAAFDLLLVINEYAESETI